MNLFFHQGALGDFVLALPIVRALAAAPGSEPITVVAAWSKGQLAQRLVPPVRSINIELFEFSRLHAPDGPSCLRPAITPLFEGAQRIISFVSDGTDAWAANMTRLATRASMIFCTTRPEPGFSGHVWHWLKKQLGDQGLDLAEVPFKARQPVQGPLLVHLGSGSTNKCWSISRFEVLLNRLSAAGRNPLPVIGEAEVERWPQQRLEHWVRRYNTALPRTLDQLCDLLESASGYIGNDTGPTHLAAQMAVPTVAMFGPTDPAQWAPRGPHVRVVAPPTPRSMEWLDEQQVWDAVLAM